MIVRALELFESFIVVSFFLLYAIGIFWLIPDVFKRFRNSTVNRVFWSILIFMPFGMYVYYYIFKENEWKSKKRGKINGSK